MKRGKKRKIILPIASFALFTALLPTFASTEIGTKACLSLLNRFSSANVALTDLSLSWLGPQKIVGLQCEETSKGMVLTCDEIKIQSGLLKLLIFSKDFNSIEILHPKLLVTSNFLSTSTRETPIKEASLLPAVGSIEIVKQKINGFKGHIYIKEGSLEVRIPKAQNVVFAPIEVDALLKGKENSSSIFLQVDTLQGETKGYLSLKGSIDDNLSLQAASSNFPLEGVDQILKLLDPRYEKALVTTLGPSLDMDCTINGVDAFFDAKLNLLSQNVKMGLQMSSKENTADLSAPAFLQITVTPESNEKASVLFPEIPLLVKNSPLVLTFGIESLHVPIQEGALAIEKASFSSSFASSPYFVAPQIQVNTKGKLSSASLQEKVLSEINLEVEAEKSFSRLTLMADLLSPLSGKPSIQASLATQKMPTSLFDTCFSAPFSTFLGPWVESAASLTGSFHTANLSFQFISPLVSFPGASLQWENNALVLRDPVELIYQLEPDLLMKLTSSDIFLKEPVKTVVAISKATISKDLFLESKITVPSLSFAKLFPLENYVFPALQITIDINTLSKIHIQAQSDVVSVDSYLKMDEEKLTLTKPLEIEWTVKQQDLLLDNLPFTLLEEAKAKFTFSPTTLSLEGDLRKSKLQARLDVTPVHLKSKERGKELTLEKIASDMSFSGPKELIDFSFTLDVGTTNTKNSLSGFGSLQKVLTTQSLSYFDITINSDNLSLALLEDFYAPPFPLSPVIGDTITSSLKVEKNPTLESFTLQAETPILKIKGSLAREKDKLFFPMNSGPLEIEYNLTPAGYKALSPNSPFSLSEKSTFVTSITDLVIPCLPNSSLPDLAGIKISATTFNDKIVFQRPGSSESLTLASSKMSLEKKSSQKDLVLNIDAKAKASSLTEGTLHLDLVLSKFLNQEGDFTLSDFQTAIKAHAVQFPSSALDIAFSLKKEPFSLILGPAFESTFSMSLHNGSGPLSFDLRSNKAHVDFLGMLEDGTLKLKKDMRADLLLTHELGKFLLKEASVSSIKSFFAPAPIAISIASKGFSFPIQSMNPAHIQAPFLRIDFGKLYCKNEGAMVNLLRQLRSNEPEGSEIQIWLAPMDIHIDSGMVEVERTEILLDKAFDVALWGQVDLPNNYVNMSFGLTASTLQQAFGITDLPKNYVIKIPIKGPLNDVQIKTSSATSKITALLLWKSNALDSVVPFGGVIKKVVPPPGDGKAPPPKTPFPWQISK